MKKTLVIAIAVFVIMAINITNARAESSVTTQYGKEFFLSNTAYMEADGKVFQSPSFDSPFKIIKKGTIVHVLDIKNPEKKYNWIMITYEGGYGWVHATPTVHVPKMGTK